MQVNLAAAAQAVVNRYDNAWAGDLTPGLDVWVALTGSETYDDALALAREYADHPAGEAIHLLTGDLPPGIEADRDDGSAHAGRLLIHVWPDGTGEVAYRYEDTDRWGVPSPLAVAP